MQRASWKSHIQSTTGRIALLMVLMMIPTLAFGQVGGGEIPGKINNFAEWIYGNVRWPVSFLGLTVAVGLAKFRDGGVPVAVGVLGATIAWALVPALVQVLKGIFG